MYGCPCCHAVLKLAKDYRRHIQDTCYKLQIYRCPDCPKCFTRKHRLAKHHKKIHPTRCHRIECVHVEQATVRAVDLSALGCGFCGRSFDDLTTWIRHLIDNHFKRGQSLADWSYDIQLISLLNHSDAADMWHELQDLQIRSCDPASVSLHWSEDIAKEHIFLLERNPDQAQLRQIIYALISHASHKRQCAGSGYQKSLDFERGCISSIPFV